MKLNLSVFAIILSSLALAISLVQSISLLPRTPAPSAFDILYFEIDETFTKLQIYNNGTDIAYNIRVLLIYESPNATSPLRQRAFPITVYIPGKYQFTDILVSWGSRLLHAGRSVPSMQAA